MPIILYPTGEREVFFNTKQEQIPKKDLTQIQDSKQYKQTAENSPPRQ